MTSESVTKLIKAARHRKPSRKIGQCFVLLKDNIEENPGATQGIVPKYTTQMARTQIGLPVYSPVGHPDCSRNIKRLEDM